MVENLSRVGGNQKSAHPYRQNDRTGGFGTKILIPDGFFRFSMVPAKISENWDTTMRRLGCEPSNPGDWFP